MRKKSVSKTVKKRAKPALKRAAPRKKKTVVKKNPVRKLTRYGVRVENVKGQTGYLSDWSAKNGPSFDTDPGKALKGGDRKLMENFAEAVAERKPRGIASVEVVIIGSPVKKN